MSYLWKLSHYDQRNAMQQFQYQNGGEVAHYWGNIIDKAERFSLQCDDENGSWSHSFFAFRNSLGYLGLMWIFILVAKWLFYWHLLQLFAFQNLLGYFKLMWIFILVAKRLKYWKLLLFCKFRNLYVLLLWTFPPILFIILWLLDSKNGIHRLEKEFLSIQRGSNKSSWDFKGPPAL